MKKLLFLLFISAELFGSSNGYVPDPFRYVRAQFRDYRNSQYSKSMKALPLEFDLRKIASTPVENQGQCGSCWAFGTKGVIEGLIMLRDGLFKEMSGQWMIDCQPANFYGCQGGDYAFKKYVEGYGSIYESEYPIKYQAANNRCQTSFLKDHYHETIKSWGYIDGSIDAIKAAIFQNEAPLANTLGSAGLEPGNDGWQESCSSASIDHLTQIWGYLDGATQGHKPGVYWILKNSWGKKFGDGGYAYILAQDKNGTKCASIGEQPLAIADYKPACTPQPKSDAGPDVNLVLSEHMPHSVEIGTPAVEGMSYSWAPSDDLDDPKSAQTFASPTKTTMYSLKATSQCGTAVSQVKVHVFSEKGREEK